MDRDNIISGKIICVDRGEAPDDSDRHLVMVVGVIAIPKTSKISREIKARGNTISVAMLAGINGGLVLSHLEEEIPDWLEMESAAGLLTNYDNWRV